MDVPISVSVPPRIAAYESGSRSFDGLILESSARPVTIGMNTATTGVLFTKPAIGPVVQTVATSARNSDPPVKSARDTPSRSTTPVFWTPALSMYMAMMVTVAGFAKPEIASRAPTPVHGSRTTSAATTAMAVTSLGTTSVTNAVRTARMSRNTTATPDTSKIGIRTRLGSPPSLFRRSVRRLPDGASRSGRPQGLGAARPKTVRAR